MALLETYFLIPQPSVRRFVLTLFARITGNADTVYPSGNMSEAQYLLRRHAQLPNANVRDKMLALVRQVCVANRGDIGSPCEQPCNAKAEMA